MTPPAQHRQWCCQACYHAQRTPHQSMLYHNPQLVRAQRRVYRLASLDMALTGIQLVLYIGLVLAVCGVCAWIAVSP